MRGELIIDNFAGGGGVSFGIEAALGRSPDYAINHNWSALYMHKQNHPYTETICEDVFKVNPAKLCAGRPVALAWFSPDCKHFSKAKGGKPVDKRIRGLAWVAVRWAREVGPRVIILENVEEFLDWGPLGEDGRPNKERKGWTFKRFVGCLKAAGYRVEWRMLIAADYGSPTTRKRFFLIARNDGRPIVWPVPTHRDPRRGAELFDGNLPTWRTAAECIDWSIPCPSIFDRSRYVRVCCGDWARILTPSVTTTIGTTAVFLDPPYGEKSGRKSNIYSVDSLTVADDVRAWCIENGSNQKLRIALCGYEGEHNELEEKGWSKLAWESVGGYGKDKKGKKLERIWFSPHCLANQELFN